MNNNILHRGGSNCECAYCCHKPISKIEKPNFEDNCNIKKFIDKYNEHIKELYNIYDRIRIMYLKMNVEGDKIVFTKYELPTYDFSCNEDTIKFMEKRITELYGVIDDMNKLISLIDLY
jgi:hypothetical protein